MKHDDFDTNNSYSECKLSNGTWVAETGTIIQQNLQRWYTVVYDDYDNTLQFNPSLNYH
jgi:hypothetical protein